MNVVFTVGDETTGWAIVDAQTDDMGQFTIHGRLDVSYSKIRRLNEATRAFNRILANTTWSVLKHNYEQFVRLEDELMAGTSELELGTGPVLEPVQISVAASIANFLTSMRMFLDQTRAELKRLDRREGVERRSDTWKNACQRERDNSFAFRFLEKFRNYVQHIGLPLSVWNISMTRDETGRFVARTVLGESPQDLLQSYNGWKELTPELRALTQTIDLSRQIKAAMDCLWRLKEVYEHSLIPEISNCVNVYNEILGDTRSYVGRPLIVRVEVIDPSAEDLTFRIEATELDMDRLEMAKRVLAGAT